LGGKILPYTRVYGMIRDGIWVMFRVRGSIALGLGLQNADRCGNSIISIFYSSVQMENNTEPEADLTWCSTRKWAGINK